MKWSWATKITIMVVCWVVIPTMGMGAPLVPLVGIYGEKFFPLIFEILKFFSQKWLYSRIGWAEFKNILGGNCPAMASTFDEKKFSKFQNFCFRPFLPREKRVSCILLMFHQH